MDQQTGNEQTVPLVQCYRCAEVVVPRIVRQTTSAGAVGIPVAGHMVYRSVDQDRHHLECPNCGAPFEDDETIRELNGAPNSETVKTLLLLFVSFSVFIAILLYVSMPSN